MLKAEYEFTSQRTLKLSRRITTQEQLEDLAIIGLGIDDHKIDHHLVGKSVTHAARHVLKEWRDRQVNRKEAYRNICLALRAVKMAALIHDME